LSEQRRIARELKEKVAERTPELQELKDQLQRENVVLREQVDEASMFEEIVGTAPVLQSVLSRVAKVAPTDAAVLITGETGTGKELIARAIHKRSARSGRAFVKVSCAAIPPSLIASELFGHEKGAFIYRGVAAAIGPLRTGPRGTLFLDEVGELPAETQISLLRVLQEHEFERVGTAFRHRSSPEASSRKSREFSIYREPTGLEAGPYRILARDAVDDPSIESMAWH
jgi:transcriptional regulator with GAF, ATPase, and Fis domain